jgi:inward rectifier potassium channel
VRDAAGRGRQPGRLVARLQLRPPVLTPPRTRAIRREIGGAAGDDVDLRKIGVARFDLRDPYHFAVTLTWGQFFGLLLAVELIVNAAFAALYALQPGSVANARDGSLSDAFFFSLETLATVGYGAMSPATLYGHVVSAVEILCGLTLTAVFTGLIFVRFSRPRAKLLFAEKAVVTTFNGMPALMLRVGNGRLSMLSDARAALTALVADETTEGHRFRRTVDMRLVRSHFPLLALTWTLVHEIDEASPLHGATSESLQADGFRMLLALEGRDHSISATVYDMRSYSAAEVAFGMRYVDAIRSDPKQAVADMTKLSLIEPDGRTA